MDCNCPPSIPSSTRRSRPSVGDTDLHDNLCIIPDSYNEGGDGNSESNQGPLQWASRQAMGERPSKESFTSIIEKQVMATSSTVALAQPLHPGHREVKLYWLMRINESLCRWHSQRYPIMSLNDWIHQPMYICTRGGIQTKAGSNWIHGPLESIVVTSCVLTTWLDSLWSEITTPRQHFQAFCRWSWLMWSLLVRILQ